MLFLLVVRPVKRWAKIADKVSLGNMEVPEFQISGSDEIAKLWESFNRMVACGTRPLPDDPQPWALRHPRQIKGAANT